ncbi:hypothetical protein REPUB_Repub07fG0202900 [Reevesia pubescens]
MMWILGNPIKIEGKEFSNERAIYISNHASPIDIFLVMWLTPTGTVGIAKKEAVQAVIKHNLSLIIFPEGFETLSAIVVLFLFHFLNVEAEKQVKFFQGCVASVFAERDHSIMEAEKAKEKEELMSQRFNEFQTS